MPSIHVIGERDPVKGLTNRLIESFDNPVVSRKPRFAVSLHDQRRCLPPAG